MMRSSISGLATLATLAGCVAQGSGAPRQGKDLVGTYPYIGDNRCLGILGYAEQYLNPHHPKRKPPAEPFPEIVDIPWLEIPVEEDPRRKRNLYEEVPDAPDKARDFFVTGKEGAWSVRVFFHPSSEHLRNLVAAHLRSKCAKMGREPETGAWKGFLTASRSTFVQHPTSGYVVSMGLPLAKGNDHILGGEQRVDGYMMGMRALRMSTLLRIIDKGTKLETLGDLIPETARVSVPIERTRLDISVVARTWPEDMLRCEGSRKRSYVPAFALHSDGVDKPNSFLKLPHPVREEAAVSDLIAARAKWLTQLLFRSGYQHATPHSQNGLLEVSSEGDTWTSTGRWGLRDVDKAHVHQSIVPIEVADRWLIDASLPATILSSMPEMSQLLMLPKSPSAELNFAFISLGGRTQRARAMLPLLSAQTAASRVETERLLDLSLAETSPDIERPYTLASFTEVHALDGEQPAAVVYRFPENAKGSSDLLDMIPFCLWRYPSGDFDRADCPPALVP